MAPETAPGITSGVTVALAVFAITAAVFWPAGQYEFLAYDDVVYVTSNPRVQGGLSWEGARWALTATDTAVNWHPVTWLAHMLDVEWFGLDAGLHHRSSVLWHAAAAALFSLALTSLLRSPWLGGLAALLFALHPLRVEPVAMIADRKDLVAGCFAAVTLSAWLRYRRRLSLPWLGLALVAFALGLASKPTLLAWPAVLWLVDRAPFVTPPAGTTPTGGTGESGWRRGWRRGRRLLPFAALALASLVPVLTAQLSAGAHAVSGSIPIPARLANAAAAIGHYAVDSVWPRNLAFFYPHAYLTAGAVPVAAWLSGLALTALALCAAHKLRARWPELRVGLLWWLAVLSPSLGLVQFGIAGRADRYTYLPSVGLAMALAALVGRVAARGQTARPAAGNRPPGTRLALATASVGLLLLGALRTRAELPAWRDSRTLTARALEVTEDNFMAHTILCNVLELEGEPELAEEHLREALRIRPEVAALQYRLARVEVRAGDLEAAENALVKVVRLRPDDGAARLSLAALMTDSGRHAAALEHLRAVFGPVAGPGAMTREVTAEDAGRPSHSGRDLAGVPVEAQRYLSGRALAWLLATSSDDSVRDGTEATRVAEACLRIDRTPEVLDALAAARAEQGRFEAAVALLEEAIAATPPALRRPLQVRREAYRARRAWRE